MNLVGNAWVEALEIDLIPTGSPGKSYANTGKVIEIKLDENYWVKARFREAYQAHKVEIKLPRLRPTRKYNKIHYHRIGHGLRLSRKLPIRYSVY